MKMFFDEAQINKTLKNHGFETLLNIFLEAFQPILLRKYVGKQRLKDNNSGIMRADMKWIMT